MRTRCNFLKAVFRYTLWIFIDSERCVFVAGDFDWWTICRAESTMEQIQDSSFVKKKVATGQNIRSLSQQLDARTKMFTDRYHQTRDLQLGCLQGEIYIMRNMDSSQLPSEYWGEGRSFSVELLLINNVQFKNEFI